MHTLDEVRESLVRNYGEIPEIDSLVEVIEDLYKHVGDKKLSKLLDDNNALNWHDLYLKRLPKKYWSKNDTEGSMSQDLWRIVKNDVHEILDKENKGRK